MTTTDTRPTEPESCDRCGAPVAWAPIGIGGIRLQEVPLLLCSPCVSEVGPLDCARDQVPQIGRCPECETPRARQEDPCDWCTGVDEMARRAVGWLRLAYGAGYARGWVGPLVDDHVLADVGPAFGAWLRGGENGDGPPFPEALALIAALEDRHE